MEEVLAPQVTGMFPLLDKLCPDTKLETETEEKSSGLLSHHGGGHLSGNKNKTNAAIMKSC